VIPLTDADKLAIKSKSTATPSSKPTRRFVCSPYTTLRPLLLHFLYIRLSTPSHHGLQLFETKDADNFTAAGFRAFGHFRTRKLVHRDLRRPELAQVGYEELPDGPSQQEDGEIPTALTTVYLLFR
jgi:hypothetical protein